MTEIDMAKQLTRLNDIREIENLQGRYLYFIQAHDYEAVANLFSKDDPEASVEISSTGVYVGFEKIKAFFTEFIGPFFNGPGVFPLHMLTTPVIDVDDDGNTAYGMWQTLGCNTFGEDDEITAAWQQGKYDNIFVKENGRWVIKQFRWLCNFRTPFDKGWVKQATLDVKPLDLSLFPESAHPTRESEPYSVYNPNEVMDFGPLPKYDRK